MNKKPAKEVEQQEWLNKPRLAKLYFNVRFKGQNDDTPNHDDLDVALSVLELKLDPDEPTSTVEEALRGEHAERWRKSIRDEMQNFLKHSVWVEGERQEVIKEPRRYLRSKRNKTGV